MRYQKTIIVWIYLGILYHHHVMLLTAFSVISEGVGAWTSVQSITVAPTSNSYQHTQRRTTRNQQQTSNGIRWESSKVTRRKSRTTPPGGTTITTTLYAVGRNSYFSTSKQAVTLAGSIWPALQKFKIGPEKFKDIVHNVVAITDWQDILFLFIVAFGTIPITKFILYPKRYLLKRFLSNRSSVSAETTTATTVTVGTTSTSESADDDSQQYDDDESNTRNKEENTKMDEEIQLLKQTKRYQVSNFIHQIGKVAISVYVVDVICIVLTTIGFTFPTKWQLSSSYAKTAYTFWAMNRILLAKKFALCRMFHVEKDEDMGQVDVLNRLCNVIVISITSLILLDWLSVKMGRAMTGLFAFGSIGTLAFTLASQGLVTQLLSGIFLILGNKMYVGDIVRFGDGTQGKVLKLGWMETLLRSSDNVETRVPNNLLSSQKVSNMSRSTISQVKQLIRFHYEDAEKLPDVIRDIRLEIIRHCPKVITNGIRPFRVYWTDFKEDHLEIMVDTHYYIPPIGDAYWANRQTVLSCILRACKKNNVELAKLCTVATMGGDVTVSRVLPPIAWERQQQVHQLQQYQQQIRQQEIQQRKWQGEESKQSTETDVQSTESSSSTDSKPSSVNGERKL